MGFPGGSAGKESACNVEDLGSISGLGRYPREGNGYPLQYPGLENSMDCIVYGVTRVRHDCVAFSSMYLSIITLTVNGLNAPVKGHRMAQWIEKQKTSKKKKKREREKKTTNSKKKHTNLYVTYKTSGTELNTQKE